jgi:hypothetical protein
MLQVAWGSCSSSTEHWLLLMLSLHALICF